MRIHSEIGFKDRLQWPQKSVIQVPCRKIDFSLVSATLGVTRLWDSIKNNLKSEVSPLKACKLSSLSRH